MENRPTIRGLALRDFVFRNPSWVISWPWSLIHQEPIHYCYELLIWAASLSPFIAIQQEHLYLKHILTTSWLQIGHMHFSSLDRSLFLFWFFGLALKYNHNAINDKPIIVKIRNTLVPDPIASMNIPNAMMPNPYINSQNRVRRLCFLFNVFSSWSPYPIIDLTISIQINRLHDDDYFE